MLLQADQPIRLQFSHQTKLYIYINSGTFVLSQELDFYHHMSWHVLVFDDSSWEVIAGLVDICDIVDHHGFNFLFITELTSSEITMSINWSCFFLYISFVFVISVNSMWSFCVEENQYRFCIVYKYVFHCWGSS
jgi:hypothetical protein